VSSELAPHALWDRYIFHWNGTFDQFQEEAAKWRARALDLRLGTGLTRVTPDAGAWVVCAAHPTTHLEWMYERHHLRPLAWGGPASLAMEFLHVVWEPLCGSCHNADHIALDEAMRTGYWPPAIWLSAHRVGYNRRVLARRGWVMHLEAIDRGEVSVPAWWPDDHDTVATMV
jgi:hypothetical protein